MISLLLHLIYLKVNKLMCPAISTEKDIHKALGSLQLLCISIPIEHEFVRSQLCLPHHSTLRDWTSSVNCEPTFLKDVIGRLQDEAQRDSRMKDCALMFDAMHIRKQTIYDVTKQAYIGFVDFGGALTGDSEKMAGETLVFMVVGLMGKWKCPIAYFLIDGASATVLCQMVNMALQFLLAADLNCMTLSCDGTSVNIECLRKLGCKIGKSLGEIDGSFPHPSVPNQRVYAILDSCHMLKLARNALSTLGSLHSPRGEIKWQFIAKLIKLQQTEGFRLGNKVISKHLQWQQMKMSVTCCTDPKFFRC